MEAEVYRRKNLKLAINQGILVNSEGGCIVDVILEAIPIFVDKESFFIVFVCKKKASAIESIKVKVGWRYLLNTVARIQYKNFLFFMKSVLLKYLLYKLHSKTSQCLYFQKHYQQFIEMENYQFQHMKVKIMI